MREKQAAKAVLSHRFAVRVVAVGCALAATLALSAAPALAVETRPYTGLSFGPDGVGGTESFVSVQGVAVDQASGDVFAYDSGAGKIYKFDAAGNPVNFSSKAGNVIEEVGGGGNGEEQIAVAPAGSPGGTAGDLYVATNATASVKVYAPDGSQLGKLGLEETCGVATDPAGHIFIGSYSHTVREYVPTGNPPTDADFKKISTAELPGICNVAADGLGNVYATNYSGSSIAKLEGVTNPNRTIIEPGAPTLTTDPVNNDLYANRTGTIAQYTAAGTLVSVFGAGQLSNSHGVAINHASDEVYAGNTGSGKIDVFGSLTVLAGVTAEAATGITGTRATLHGTVNPAGLPVTGCNFEYGIESFTATKPCEGALPADEADHPVTATLTGLTPNANYFFRITVSNANGSNGGTGPAFVTPQSAVTNPATEVGGTKATLNGAVFPEGEAILECFFEYGETESYGATVPCEGATPPDEIEHPVSAIATGLNPGGVYYHFRLVVKRPSGEAKGVDQTFLTRGAILGTERTASVGAEEATVEGKIDPRGIADQLPLRVRDRHHLREQHPRGDFSAKATNFRPSAKC